MKEQVAQHHYKKQYRADVAEPGVFARATVPGKQDIPRRRTSTRPPKNLYVSNVRNTEEPLEIIVKHTGQLPAWLFPLGSAMFGLFLFLVLLSQVVIPWFTAMQDQWNYGTARVSYQTLVIRGKSRDLLGVGYKGRIEVIELADPDDKTSKAAMYIAPEAFADGQSRVVTVELMDVNHDGVPDLVLHVEGSQVSPVLYGLPDGTFQWNLPQKG